MGPYGSLFTGVLAIAWCVVLLLTTREATAQSLSNGGVTHGAIVISGQQVSYTFFANANEWVRLRVAEVVDTAFAPAIAVYAPSGGLVGSSRDYVVTGYDFFTNSTGTYTVVVGDAGANTGTYDLYYARAPGANEHGALVNGGVHRETIDRGDLDSYTFFANAGEGIQLRVAEPADTPFAPLVAIYTPNGASVGSNSNYIVAGYAFETTTTGTYTVVVSDSGAATGAYNLYFTRAPGANEHGALAHDSTRLGRVDVGDLDSYTFSVTAGTNVLVRLREAQDTAFLPAFSIYGPTGASVGSTSNYVTAAYTFNALASGTYTVVLYDNASNAGDYELYLSAPGAALPVPVPAWAALTLAALLLGVGTRGARRRAAA